MNYIEYLKQFQPKFKLTVEATPWPKVPKRLRLKKFQIEAAELIYKTKITNL